MTLQQRLRDQAALVRQWDKFELGMKAPEAMNYAALADLLDEASERIEELEQ